MDADAGLDRRQDSGLTAALCPTRPCPAAMVAGTVAAGRPVMSLYLGVFLGVFCFFALLVGATEGRHRAASLPAVPGAAMRPAPSPAPAGNAIRHVSADGPALAALAEFAAVGPAPGRALQLTLPQTLVFAGTAPQVRPSAIPLLDSVVTILASNRQAMWATADLVLLRPPAPASARMADAIMAERAQALTRALLARGAPIDRLGIGIAAAAGDTLTLTLRFAPDGDHGG